MLSLHLSPPPQLASGQAEHLRVDVTDVVLCGVGVLSLVVLLVVGDVQCSQGNLQLLLGHV